MLVEANIAQSYWAEAISTASYTQNRSGLNLRLNKTPYEIYKGHNLSLTHLCPFGCPCYIYNNGKSKLNTFPPKADEGILLGYEYHSHKPFRVFNKQLFLWK